MIYFNTPLKTNIPSLGYKLLKQSTFIAAISGGLVSQAFGRDPLQPYHVEVIVFERAPLPSVAPEQWAKDIALAYPPNYRVISLPNEPPTLGSEESNIDNSVHTDAFPEEHSTELQISQNTAITDLTFDSQRVFYERPDSTYLLGNHAYSLNNKHAYRVLFHKAWQQTLEDENTSPSVIITGGDVYDDRHELGGSMRLSVNKYIHIDTNLWLTRFMPNLGQGSLWPMPPSEPSASSEGHSLQQAPQSQSNKLNHFELNNRTLNYLPSNNAISIGYTSQGTKIQETKYLADRIIQIKQSRRMRSRELHYIDHPIVGILIKIEPIDEAEEKN